MQTAVILLAIAGGVIAVTALARRIGLSAPLLLMLVGIVVGAVISLVPDVPDLHLEPEIVLIGLLPPLLYATAIKTSVIDFRSQLTAIGYLSIGLVLATALLVGVITWAILPEVSFATAFALGAVVAPPDAVAATAVAKRIGLPRRLVSLLEGESLVNDATAITCLRTALVAMAAASAGSSRVTAVTVAETFVLALVGGVAIGAVAAFVIARIRRYIRSSITDTALSFVAPFVSYLPAEAVESSGVIAVVTTGLILGHKAPLIQTARSRLSERTNWSTIQFLLENAVFLLIGLQFTWIIRDVVAGEVPGVVVLGLCAAVLAAVIVLRLIWVVVGMTLLLYGRHGRAKLRLAVVGGWAGMRGVVTLAAALLLPEATTQNREILLLVAMVVTAGTLLLHGLTLGPLARRLGVVGPDPREDALALAAVLEQVTTRAITRLEQEQIPANDAVMDMVRSRATTRTNSIWERLGRGGTTVPTEEYRTLRLTSLTYEREELLKLRSGGTADQEIVTRALGVLDVEESTLASIPTGLDPVEARPLTAPAGTLLHQCADLEQAGTHEPTSTECLDCRREGTETVHLRMCLTCGNVGCCDSSEGLHADRHFRTTGHPVMRSIEPGESWRWCYVHAQVG